MKKLAIDHNGKICASSRLIAERFQKEHKNILRAIRNLKCDKEFKRLNYKLVDYTDSFNRSQKEYLITRDGFLLLVMGFTGKKATLFKERTFLEDLGERREPLVNESYAFTDTNIDNDKVPKQNNQSQPKERPTS